MLQLGLLNFDDKTEQELLSVVQHLLVCVIDDPGVPNRPEAVSVLNQNVRDVDVTNSNVSEVLRLFFNALDGTSKMCKWVTEKPFLSLNPTHKSEIIAFLCNELLCSRAVLRQIEYNIETVNNLRRDKWVVEGNLRKLRNLQQTRALKSLVQSHKENSQTVVDGSKMSDVNEKTNKSNTRITMNGDTSVDGKVTENKSAKGNKGRSKYEEEENDDESGNESDATQATSRLSDGEDEELGLSNEELEKKIEKLSKQQAQFHSKLTKAAHTIRGTCFGQDRYCRLYWVTPCAGGIFVEGVESSGVENENIEEQDKTPDTSLEKLENKEKCVDKTRDENVVEEKHVTHTESKLKEVNSNVSEELKAEEENCIKIVPQVIPGNEEQSKSLESKEENSLMNTNENKEKVESTTSKREQTLKTSGTNISSDSPSHYINVKKESPTKLKSSSEVVVLPEIGDKLTNSIKLDIPNTSTSSVPSIEQNWLLHSPFFASVLAGSMLMNGPLLHGRELNGSYFNLPKIEPPVSSSSYGPLLGLNPTFLSAEQMLKTLSEKQSTQKPWFSVLPRMPCDNTSITQGSPCKHTPSKSSEETHRTLSNSSQPPTTSHSQSTPISSMAGHSSPAAALALANLHLGILNGFPPPLIPNPLLNPSVMNSLYTTTEPSRLTSTPNSLGTSVTPSVNPPSFCSTPSTVPSPSSTPGPVPYGSYSNCSIEDSPQVQQRLLTEKLSQYATPRVIPK
ncbi:bromodomain adjacent to zinc finger domain protein 2B-like, partial [Limulus polyphemus]|uniref:Bromodomain adjacent to zinc finger domain protein 2B-like n=1 Tax=Limulus polyphemus TaxID=6850 RepID=A0ABM1C2G1_LIMPO